MLTALWLSMCILWLVLNCFHNWLSVRNSLVVSLSRPLYLLLSQFPAYYFSLPPTLPSYSPQSFLLSPSPSSSLPLTLSLLLSPSCSYSYSSLLLSLPATLPPLPHLSPLSSPSISSYISCLFLLSISFSLFHPLLFLPTHPPFSLLPFLPSPLPLLSFLSLCLSLTLCHFSSFLSSSCLAISPLFVLYA